MGLCQHAQSSSGESLENLSFCHSKLSTASLRKKFEKSFVDIILEIKEVDDVT